MIFKIEMPDEMIECGAVDALTICLQEQVDALIEEVKERLG